MTSTIIVHLPSTTIVELINFLIGQLKERGSTASTLVLKQKSFQLFRDLFTHKPCPIATNNFAYVPPIFLFNLSLFTLFTNLFII